LNYFVITSTPLLMHRYGGGYGFIGVNPTLWRSFSIVVLLSACDKGRWDDAGENWKRSTAREVSGIIQT